MTPPLPGIHLDGASVVLDGKTILPPLTLSLHEQRIGVIGRNGSGKSTLLRLIAGLTPPAAGRVRVDGLNPAKDRKGLLARLGILFQNPDHQILFPTVEEELAFGLTQIGHPDPPGAVRALLAEEGRSHWAKAATHSLSQGQRRYLCLLAVLLMRPATILLDEPFAGLDIPTRIRLGRRLAALPQRLITITHSPDELAHADRILWLDAGRICKDGPAAETLAAFHARMAHLAEADADTHLAG